MKIGVWLDSSGMLWDWTDNDAIELPDAPRVGDELSLWSDSVDLPADFDVLDGLVTAVRWQIGGGPVACHVDISFLRASTGLAADILTEDAFAKYLAEWERQHPVGGELFTPAQDGRVYPSAVAVAEAMADLDGVLNDPEQRAAEIARIDVELASDRLSEALASDDPEKRAVAEDYRRLLLEQRGKLSEEP